MRKSSTTSSISSSLYNANGVNGADSTSTTSLLASDVPPVDVNHLKLAGGRVFGDQIIYPAEARLAPRTPDSSSDEDDATSVPSASRQPDPTNPWTASAGPEAHIKTQERNPRDSANIDTWERFSTRSRPLTLLTELVPRQNRFASKVFRLVSARATIETDVSEIVSDEKSKQLSDWCESNLTLWMPHISNAYQIRQEAKQGKQTLSTQLLEQVLYVIAMQHIRDPKDDVLRFSVTRFVIRDLARVMITSPRSSKAVEALELLALFPVDVSAIPGPSRNRIRSDSQISAAERFARSVRLDRVALTAAAPYSFFTSSNQLDDFETKRTAMAWASVKTWYNCFTLGDDELYESIDIRYFSDDWSRSLILPTQELPTQEPLATDALAMENELFAQRRWSTKRGIGSTGLAMRCLAMRHLLVAFDAINKCSIRDLESERLASVSTTLDDYVHQVTEVDNELQRRLIDGKHGSNLLRTWLTIETTAGHLLVLSAGIFRGLGIDKKENVPGHELALLIRGEIASPELRAFLSRYGEHLILAAEKVLINISTLCRDARAAKTAPISGKGENECDPTSSRWMVEGQSRTVLPMINVCGYALEAAFNAIEMHATMFKLWKAPPKRSDSWQLVFSNLVAAMLSLDPSGSIQSGSIPATCAYILQGMLKVIVAWTDCSRKKDHQRCTKSTSVNTSSDDPARRDPGSRDGHQQQQPGVRPHPGAASNLERYPTLLKDNGASRRSFDAMQADKMGATSSLPRPPGASRPTSDAASSFSTTASMFEAEAPNSYQSRHARGENGVQQSGPDATESLAAALASSGSVRADSVGTPLYPHQSQALQSQQDSFFTPYAAGHPNSSTLGASGSSNASLHTNTPPPYYDGLSNRINMIDSASHTSTFSLANRTSANMDMQHSAAAYDSLDFILNDVLVSSEWSGILHDIWRTDV